jgi:hypothetical protein
MFAKLQLFEKTPNLYHIEVRDPLERFLLRKLTRTNKNQQESKLSQIKWIEKVARSPAKKRV